MKKHLEERDLCRRSRVRDLEAIKRGGRGGGKIKVEIPKVCVGFSFFLPSWPGGWVGGLLAC